MLVSYNWLQKYTGDLKESAEEVAGLLGKHSFEIEGLEEKDDDTIIDIDVLPNRASDCLCHLGIAKEVAVLTGQELANDPLRYQPELKTFSDVEISIENKEACPRFTASLVNGIKVKESPTWLKQKLELIGQRSINNVVDATNYVMFALGQPMHVYDADLFPQSEGKWKLGVRMATEGETVSLLAEKNSDEDRVVELKETDQLIVDNSSNTPIGLAGVKGGSFAGVHEETTNIIIEAAHFHPIITRKTARRLGIVIDASKRFENEPSRELPSYAQAEILKLILDIAGGEYVGTVDEYLEKQINAPVEIEKERVNSHLGLALETTDMEDILKNLGCEVSIAGDTLTATPPFVRTDLNIEEDFIEEIGRIHGYEHIASIPPEPRPVSIINKKHYYAEKIRSILLGLGFSEVITSSFRKKDEIQLQNAMASDKSCLRSNLSKNIAEALDKNAGLTDLLGTKETRIFEIGTVFYKGEKGIDEHVSLALGVRCKPGGYSGKEDKLLQTVLETLQEELAVTAEFTVNKGVAECNLTELLKALPDPTSYEPVEVGEEVVYQPFSSYPSVSRDIAMWVSEDATKEKVEAILNEAAGDLRVRTTFMDEFTKDGRTSLAYRLVFQSDNRTLTDSEINELMEEVYEKVSSQGWEVR